MWFARCWTAEKRLPVIQKFKDLWWKDTINKHELEIARLWRKRQGEFNTNQWPRKLQKSGGRKSQVCPSFEKSQVILHFYVTIFWNSQSQRAPPRRFLILNLLNTYEAPAPLPRSWILVLMYVKGQVGLFINYYYCIEHFLTKNFVKIKFLLKK